MDIQLNQRQRELYLMLDRSEYPKFLNEFIAHPKDFIHFLVACQALWDRRPAKKPWIAYTIVPAIRRQMRELTTRQIRLLTQTAAELISDTFLRAQALLAAFGVNPEDRTLAVRNVKKLSEILLEGNFLLGGHAPTWNLLLNLIANQDTTLTWKVFMLALKDGDPDAGQAFINLFELLHTSGDRPEFLPKSVVPDGIYRTPDGKLQLAVPDDCLVYVQTLSAELTERYIPDNEQINRVLLSFWASRDAIQQKAFEMWREVEVAATCDLSPAGTDGAEISISALREHGARRIQLIPLDDRPGARVIVWFESVVSKRNVYFELELRQADLELRRVDPEKTYTIVKPLYRYLAIQAIWRISMGRTRADRSGVHADSNGNGHGKVPRPHFRQIDHLGFHPSAEAIEKCYQHWKRTPPAGKTFVKPEDFRVAPIVLDPAHLSVVCRISERMLHA